MARYVAIHDPQGYYVSDRPAEQPPEAAPIPVPVAPPAATQPTPSLASMLPPAPPRTPPAKVPSQSLPLIWLLIPLLLIGGLLAVRSVVTPAPSTVAATATVAPATAIIAPIAPRLRLPGAVVAYAAPGGDIIGAIEPGRVYTPTMRLGTWVQVEMAGSGVVWLKVADLPASALAGIPDSRPTAVPSAVPAVVAPAPVVACTETNASYFAQQRVVVEGRPIGEVAAWSCISQADADSKADQQAAKMAQGR